MHDDDSHSGQPPKILRFPTLAERDRARKEKAAQDRAAAPRQPFFNTGNIPPFAKYLFAVIALTNAAMFLLLDDAGLLRVYYMFGFVPGYYTGAAGAFPLTALFGPLTHMIVHGGWMHLFFNLAMGLPLTMAFERQYGTRLAILFFLICGLAGVLLFFVFNPFSTMPMVGASGAISGLFAALILMLARMHAPAPRRFGPWPLIGFWLLFMIGTGLASGGGLAWQAHLGGFLTGIGLTVFWLRPGRV